MTIKSNFLSRICKLGSKNPQWKGNKVGYNALHDWIRSNNNFDKKCNNCNKSNVWLDLANKSGKYKRNLSDWEYLCRKCHMTKDGRLQKAGKNLRMYYNNCLKNRKPSPPKRIEHNCLNCRIKFSPFIRDVKRGYGKFCSRYCLGKFYSKGERNGNSKLKENDVLKIRNIYKPKIYTRARLAKKFNVSIVTIDKIIWREIWKHI